MNGLNVARHRHERVVWTALLILALGAGSHLWHHLTEPHCEDPLRGTGHVCSLCNGFHGGILAGHSAAGPEAPPQPPFRISLPAAGHAVTIAAPVGPTRGPPTA